jgi:hypothetical protein
LRILQPFFVTLIRLASNQGVARACVSNLGEGNCGLGATGLFQLHKARNLKGARRDSAINATLFPGVKALREAEVFGAGKSDGGRVELNSEWSV